MLPITILNQDNVPTGPFTRAQVAEKLQSGEVSPRSLAFVEGLAQWTPLSEVLAKVDAGTPPPVSTPPPLVVAAAPLAHPPTYSYAATMQPPSGLAYAGFWIRFAAHFLDSLIVSIPFIFVWFMIVVAVAGSGVFVAPQMQDGHMDPAVMAAWFGTIIIVYLSLIFGRLLVTWLYHALLESGPHQSTWGKRVLGLKVTNIAGDRITFGHATGRYFSTILTNMTMGVGYIMVAFTERKQALHDMIAGTLVVRK